MPRYYLNVEYLTSFGRDEEGAEFENPSAAMAEARAVAKELLVESIRCDRALVPKRVDVLDDASREVGTILVRDIVPRSIC